MAKFLKERENYLIKMARKYWGWALLLIIVICLIVGFLYYIRGYKVPIWIGIAVLISYIVIYRLIGKFEKKGDDYYQGNEGEKKIGDILKNLPDNYSIIPDIKKPQGDNIDFVVVSPTGIYALEVKNPKHPSKVDFDGEQLTFNGKRWNKDPLSQTLRNAASLGDYLEKELNKPSLFVKPVLVFASHMDLHFGLKKINHVGQVICKEYLIELLTEEKTIFSEQEVTNIAQKVREFEKTPSKEKDTR